MVLPKQQYRGEAEQSANPPPCKSPPKLGRAVFGSREQLEGEGSMVLRRTVCGRRPWSEALAGGGPSIPLPFHPQEKEPYSGSCNTSG